MNRLFLVCGIVIVLLSSCHDKNDPPEPETVNRTVIVYIVGDNSLNSAVATDINEMETGWDNSYNGNLVVYVDQRRTAPYVLKIQHDNTSKIASPEVLNYSEQNSCSIEVMEKVIADIKAKYPAESYGLILWSHASGWLPTDPFSRAFGEDAGVSMEISELAKLSGKYDFILFDACFMAGVEPVYELRNNADYIVASVAEVLFGGYPYQHIVKHLFKDKADLTATAEAFMSYYKSFRESDMRSATMSVINTREMEDLASISRVLVQKYKTNIPTVNLSKIQKYDSYSTTLFFDFKDFIENIADENDPNLTLFNNQLKTTVIYSDHTPAMMDIFNIDHSCGLSCYIQGRTTRLDNIYKTTEWYKRVYAE